MTISEVERDAILAGLRLLEAQIDLGELSEEIEDIYTNGDKHDGLPLADIDDLCERMNR